MSKNNIQYIKNINENNKSKTLIIPVLKDKDFSIDLLDTNANTLLKDTLLNECISANGEITVLHTPKSLFPNFNYLRIFCIGLGTINESDVNSVRKSGGNLGKIFFEF